MSLKRPAGHSKVARYTDLMLSLSFVLVNTGEQHWAPHHGVSLLFSIPLLTAGRNKGLYFVMPHGVPARSRSQLRTNSLTQRTALLLWAQAFL